MADGAVLQKLGANWRRAFRETVESALAAALAWWLGRLIFGSEHTPLFAAVAAVVCLAPALPSHSKQAFGLLLGVVVGIGVGEAVLAISGEAHPAILGGAVFVSMMLATTFKVQPIIGIQAGVSTIIVLVEGQAQSSFARMIDALIGGGVALVFSQMLLTPDPFAIMKREGQKMIDAADALADALRQCRGGETERSKVDKAIRAMDEAAMSLEEELDYVERIARRTLRGRWRREDLEKRAGQWREWSRRLRLALDDVAHGVLAREGEAGAGEKLDEAGRWLDAGRSLSSGRDGKFRAVKHESTEEDGK
ncbi:FUSC family protein [Aurantiacibacter poecillastricola]|uniref:FUSC family protein n=1 Tax=Aurantiacibacter poecillastricola TaxID=3064385 RepID=UPI00273F9DC0|nr:FUSC family protein [Aurantiacibacter sp. 219JJ12-13]MDP5260850.1 FUSC family protein [Aurantiacibacter sp. 219JJ12-13]